MSRRIAPLRIETKRKRTAPFVDRLNETPIASAASVRSIAREFGAAEIRAVAGVGAAAPIGPVNVEIARRTLRGGFRAGFALGCGAVSVDVFYAILSSQGLKRVVARPGVVATLGVAGAAMLLYLAGMSFRAAWRARKADPIETGSQRRETVRGAYVTGVLMTLLNPMTLGFWFVAVPGALGPITEEPSRDLPMICAGVFVGTLGWVVLFAGLLALAGRRHRRRAWLAAADALGGATLLGFALLALWRLRGAFL
jgi:L-lysine exporter family protein LysE/ArgO